MKKLVLIIPFLFAFQFSFATSFILGKQYQLKQKRVKGSLYWQSVMFEKSISGGFKITFVVFNTKGKTLEFLDEYKDFVNKEIQEYCVSKFSLSDTKVSFDEEKKTKISFQVKKIKSLMYLPLKVSYTDGFEDYLTRIRIKNSKLAISTRPLQQGKLKNPEALLKKNIESSGEVPSDGMQKIKPNQENIMNEIENFDEPSESLKIESDSSSEPDSKSDSFSEEIDDILNEDADVNELEDAKKEIKQNIEKKEKSAKQILEEKAEGQSEKAQEELLELDLGDDIELEL